MTPIVISYPKSGRTWLRYITHLAGCEVEYIHAASATSPRLLGKHRVGACPERFLDRPLVFLHRNPIDTTVSLYFQVWKKDLAVTRAMKLRYWWYHLARRIPPADMTKFCFHPGFGVEKTCRFNRQWLDQLHVHPRHLVLTYEDMRSQPMRSLEQFFAHLGLTPKRPVAELVEESSFERMKDVERAGQVTADLRLGMSNPDDPNSAKVRSGKVRGYRNHLDEATIVKLRQICTRYGFEA